MKDVTLRLILKDYGVPDTLFTCRFVDSDLELEIFFEEKDDNRVRGC